VTFREVEEVLQSIKEAISYGYETFHICFDPYPRKPEYFLDLFSRIRQERIRMECFFESFGLPISFWRRECIFFFGILDPKLLSRGRG
jgi:hypothetical protein